MKKKLFSTPPPIHHTPILQQKLALSTSLVSNLPAEVQQILMEMASINEEETTDDDNTGHSLEKLVERRGNLV